MYTAHMRRIFSAPEIKSVESLPDERSFYNLFLHFNRRQRRFHSSLPTIRGAPVNLFALFTAVVQHGGYAKVTEKNLWESVSRAIGCPSACVNYSIALRRVYCQYLVAFENESFPHLRGDSIWSQLQDEFQEGSGDMFTPPSVEKMLGIVNPIPAPIHSGMQRSATHIGFSVRDPYLNMRYPQDFNRFSPAYDQLTPSQQWEELYSRPHPDNAFDLRHLSVLETAEKSLMSGLPNEIDLSLNSILFLSAVVHPSLATPLRLSSTRNLLQLMLATVGVYEDGPASLRPLFETQPSASNLDFNKFWQDVAGCWVNSSLREDAFLYREHSVPMVHDAETAGYRVVPPPSPDSTYDLFSPSSSHSTHLFGDSLGSNIHLTRVLTVATTLVNCVTPPYLPGLPPPLEEDDDEIEQVMAFASVSGRRSSSYSSDTIGRPLRGRSLFPAPTVIPPLATWRDNARFLSSHPVAIRFAFLCAYARHSGLRQLGLQLVSALRYPLILTHPAPPPPTASVVPKPLHLNTFTGIELISVRFLVRCLLQSMDRCDLLSGLSLLTNLLRVPEGVNVECLFAGLPRSLWGRLIQLLCLSDLAVVCAVLEALYTATGMGSLACTRLWHAVASADDTVSERSPATVFTARRASIHLRPLIALLSLEGQSMGTGSLHRVKVMQRQPQPIIAQVPPPPVVQPPQAPLPQMMVAPSPMHPVYQHHLHYPQPHHPVQPPPPQYLPSTVHHPAQCYPISPLPGPHLAPSRPSPQVQPRPLSPHPPSSLASLLGTAAAPPRPPPVAPPTLCVPPQVANVKPEASSLSELTDRLQMPPPQMPPPRRTPSKLNPCGNGGGSPSRFSLVNGKTPPQTTVNSPVSTPTHPPQSNEKPPKSLLEEVLNAPSNKAATSPLASPRNGPPLVNGGGTVHHVAGGNGIKKELLSKCLSTKLLNGETTPIKKAHQQAKADVQQLVNGVAHDDGDEEKEEADLEKPKDTDDVETQEVVEKGLMEAATFLTHFLRFNRRVGFYYTRKRPRDFALRHRFLKDTGTDSSLVKRRRNLVKTEPHTDGTVVSPKPSSSPPPPSSSPPPPPPPVFTCEWGSCMQQFPSAKQISCHVYKFHLKPDLPPRVPTTPIERRCCQWTDCASSNLPRAPFALISHVLEQHCSPEELESRRRSMASPPAPPPLSSSQVPPPHPCPQPATPIRDQSGWVVIKEVETRRLQSDLWVSQVGFSGRYYNPGVGRIVPPPREGPVTKHLRVTAALILRNLAKHVPEARRWLLSETPLLCEIAMGTCPGASSLRTNDAGRIIASCLAICTSGNSYPFSPSLSSDFHDFYDLHTSGDDGDLGGDLSLLQRLELIRRRASVDLDA
uniref:C2H2-type domain-containing protein n=2 Tax=Mesocestoides corti TaxID=53468 RepID=A0A5K3FAU4_MESCO